jgi:transposase
MEGFHMATKTKVHPDLKVIPMLANESLYVGIDVGKLKHVAGFVSNTLLQRHERFEACPALTFEQSREGFRSLIDRICSFVPLEQVYVLMEQTGHYHRALQQYLLDMDLPVYVMHVLRRPSGMLKTDKRDALGLANHLYSQLELGVQVADKLQFVRRAAPPTEAAAQLKGMVRHRYELINESTQRKNKLTAICDELFPELVQVFKDPNGPTALDLREKFPTPHAVATASLSALREIRARNFPSNAQLVQLQDLANQSIGTKEPGRLRGLLFEQKQLVKELRLLQEHIEQLDAEITKVIEQDREGKILTSIPVIGPIQAATIIATIGSIANFDSAAALKSYFGWAPIREQTGISFDRTHLTHGGVRTVKKMMYLIVWTAIRQENEWARIYERLVPRMCVYDERTRRYRGRGKVIGRLAGQIISMIYALLKKDYEVLDHLAPGASPPDPVLYDPEVHKRHREGQYQALKHWEKPQKIIQLPKRG